MGAAAGCERGRRAAALTAVVAVVAAVLTGTAPAHGQERAPVGGARASDPVEAPEAYAGVYIRLGFGLGSLFATDLDRRLPDERQRNEATFGLGWVTTVGVGYQIDRSWAIEVELAYRSTEIEDVVADETGATAADGGDFASLGVALNVLYTLPLEGPLRPYLGVGVGFAEEIDIDLKSPTGSSGFSDIAITYQAIAGLRYDTPLEGLFLTLELRYFGATGFVLENEEGNDTADVLADYDGFSAQVGVAYRF